MQNRTTGSISFDAGSWPLEPDRPTLVFIHGAANNRLFWRHQVEGLAAYANTIAIDLPGHGNSPGPGCDTIADYAQTVVSWLSQLNVPDPIPCGLSMGGAITLQLLMDRGRQFSRGVLINTGARLKVSPVIFDTIETDFDKFVASIVHMGLSPGSDKQALRARIQKIVDCGTKVAYNDFKACDRFDIMDRLGTIQSSVLVLTAEDDRLTPAKYGNFMGQKIAGSTVVNIAAAGHLSPLERPDAVNAAIHQFL